MTPEERAEKIVDKFWGSTEPTVIDRQMVKAIAAEIRAAVEGHRCDQVSMCRSVNDNCIYWAKQEAYEDAAKIADFWASKTPETIAIRIRARAKELQ